MATTKDVRPTRNDPKPSNQERQTRQGQITEAPTTGDGYAGATPGIEAPHTSSRPKRRQPWKSPGKRISDDYRITMELGLVFALLIVFGLTQLQFEGEDTFTVTLDEQEVVEMEEVQQTQQQTQPPPPPRPPTPVEVPDNTIVEQQTLNFDASLDLNEELDVGGPPPKAEPPPVKEEEEEEDEIFVAVEESPELIGGLAALQEKVEYPRAARRANIEGRVIVQFVVNENGDVINPTVVRGRHPLLDKEALRVIQLAKFKPGKQRGQPVKVRMAMPINFQLADRYR